MELRKGPGVLKDSILYLQYKEKSVLKSHKTTCSGSISGVSEVGYLETVLAFAILIGGFVVAAAIVVNEKLLKKMGV
jgi:hypothetical protein